MKRSLGILILLLNVSCGQFSNLSQGDSFSDPNSPVVRCPSDFTFDQKTGFCRAQNDTVVSGIPTYAKRICRDQLEDEERSITECGSGKPISSEFLSLLRGDGICLPGAKYIVDKKVCAEAGIAYGPFTDEVLGRCNDQSGSCEDLEIDLDHIRPVQNAFFCKSGWQFDESLNLCVSGDKVLGPFSSKMIEQCKSSYPSVLCDKTIWNRGMVEHLPNETACLEGTWFETESGYCRDEHYYYGPFVPNAVESCIEAGGERECLGNRWPMSLFKEPEVLTEVDKNQDSPTSEGSSDIAPFNNFSYIPGSRSNPSEDWVVMDEPKWDYIRNELLGMLGSRSHWGIDIRIIGQASGKRYVLLQHNAANALIPASNNKIMSAMSSYLNNGVSWNSIGNRWFKMSNNPRSQTAYSSAGGYWGVRKAIDRLGVSMSGSFRMVDGSGLSYSNKVSARNLSHIMVQANRQSWAPSWVKAMPLNCKDGSTMRKMFCSGMPSSTHIRAKTGTLGSQVAVKALSGYGLINGSSKMVFSIIYNGPAGANRQWAVGQPIIERVIKRALRFTKNFTGSGKPPYNRLFVEANQVPKYPGVLKDGSSSYDVKLLQLRLRSYGFYSKRIDGDYGQITENAVAAFQRQRGLNDDGIVGSDTWKELWPDKNRINWLKAWNVDGKLEVHAMNRSHCAYKVASNEVPAMINLLSKVPGAGTLSFGGEKKEDDPRHQCPDFREVYGPEKGVTLPAPKSTNPVAGNKTTVTWHKVYRGTNDYWTIVSYAGNDMVEVMESNVKAEIMNHLKKHGGAHSIVVASDSESFDG